MNEVYLRFLRSIEFEEAGRVTNNEKAFLDVRLLSNEKIRGEFLKYKNNLSELFNTIRKDYSTTVSYNG